VPRLALSKREEAEALGISVDHLERQRARTPARRLRRKPPADPICELERFLAESATTILDP
jgi:hypothetical protein